jgi:DNA polymerase-3 subunit epsilon
MRQIILDTETTGLSPQQGHRVIEIGCVELVHRRLTGKTFHTYLQPDRAIDEAATRVHGITDDFLKDKPRFQNVAEEFKAFIKGAELIIHNAPFDVGFLENEFQLLKDKAWTILDDHCSITDTLAMARTKHPGQRNNLDALCKRYSVDNQHREKHGALLDAEILAEVYLAMTGGQNTLMLDDAPTQQINMQVEVQSKPVEKRDTMIIKATDEEMIAHQAFLDKMDKGQNKSIWRSSFEKENVE